MVKNNIFNQKKMKEYIDKYSNKLTINQLDKNPVSDWINRLNENSLEKEKQNYINFKDIILERLLGYTLEDIEFEHDPGSEGRPVEFTLKQKDNEYVVVEAKGTKTKDLNRRYNREQSAIEQATNYASIKKETQWAIVTNYDEFRLFNPNYREQYISFKFKELRDEEILKQFLLSFSKFSLIEKDIPKQLLKETIHLERDIEDEFYQLFSETRLMIIKELEYSGLNKENAIRYSQLILNRYIFACFAEDIGLIPSETTIKTIKTPIDNQNLFDFTIWDRINELFRFIDKGNPKKDIAEFNGGLFKENLRHLEIRDIVDDNSFYDDCKKKWKFEEKYKEIEKDIQEYKDELNPIYKNLLVISSVDFESELDVNILGHIFENSIGDIEELKDQTKTRRKKDGVYYTPEYITDYICRNTIIPFLSKSGNTSNISDLIEEYSTDLKSLDKKLRKIKIIDPACGSGAFLNKAADILLEIHEKLYEEHIYDDEENLNKWFNPTEERKKILLNNIYGVDLNEESVELTKLAMFIKVAQKGIKLPTLDNNIKCGNSLIDDEDIVGNKAFKWEEEFKEIFEQGGFDVVVGNPPYGIDIDETEFNYYLNNYPLSQYKINLYLLFIEKILYLFKKSTIGLIIPKSLCFNTNLDKIRYHLLKNTSIKEITYIKEKVFLDAEVGDSIILNFRNEIIPNNEIKLIRCDSVNSVKNEWEVSFTNKETFLNTDLYEISFISSNEESLKEKIDNMPLLKDYFTVKNGINLGNIKHILISNDKTNEFHKPIIWGKNITKYHISWSGDYILYDSNIKKKVSVEDIKTKSGMKKQTKVDFSLRTIDLFENKKIIIRKTSDSLISSYDQNNYYFDSLAHGIYQNGDYNLKVLMLILNSRTATYIYQLLHDIKGKTFAKINIKNLENFPIPKLDKIDQKNLIEYADEILELNQSFHNEISNFNEWVKYNYNIDKLSKKLTNYYKLNFDEFLDEMTKKKVKINKKVYLELKNDFEDSLEKIIPLQKQIKNIDNQINNKVYELYNLNKEEIELIEKNIDNK